jgi:16S rRNA (guanine(527)-N(7))-methyltransferase RsmG
LRFPNLRKTLLTMPLELSTAIRKHQESFSVSLPPESLELLDAYYAFLLEHNPILHLTAPMEAEEFATRHILESLTMTQHLPENARFADVGAGAGLPSIPCLIARPDLGAILIESKEKKARFLTEALERLNLENRAKVVSRQFSETDAGTTEFVACRALDKLTERLPKLAAWSGDRTMLLFGGENLRSALQTCGIAFAQQLMPLSERRFLFVAERKN